MRMLRRLECSFVATCVALGVWGCGSPPDRVPDMLSDSGSPPSDAGQSVVDSGLQQDPDASEAFTPGPHEPFPQLTQLGGPVLAHPRVVSITFPGYVHEAAVRSFGEWVTTSAWLETVGEDYGVGAGSYAGNVVLDMAAPASATDADTRALITAKIEDGTLPAPTSDTVYVLYYPTSTSVTNFAGRTSCPLGVDGAPTVGGYHWEAVTGTTRFAYAVLPTCSITSDALVYLEVSSSHELIEAATDPLPNTSAGWVLADRESSWNALTGENADLCDFLAWIPTEGHWVQPVWSNSKARTGGSPCVPAAPGPYFNTSVTPSTIRRVARGSSVELELRGWSDAPSEAWALVAESYGAFDARPSLTRDTMTNGESASLTVTVPASARAGSMAVVYLYSVRSWATLEYNFWPVVVEAI